MARFREFRQVDRYADNTTIIPTAIDLDQIEMVTNYKKNGCILYLKSGITVPVSETYEEVTNELLNNTHQTLME